MDKHNRKSRAPWQMAPRAAPVKSDTLQVPQLGRGSAPDSAGMSRRQTRRLSIHQAAAQHMFDAASIPPLPEPRGNNGDDIVSKLKHELHDKDATSIEDFHQSLMAQRRQLDGEIKAKINENQKNILHLTGGLKDTQDELVQMRASAHELYGILGDFRAAAERRLALEEGAEGGEARNRNSGAAKNANAANANAANANGRANGIYSTNGASGRARDRSSLLVLEKMWASELQSLYKHVDGAHKFVQPSPGRHVLAESGRWHEINVGTWKPTRAIHLFLLNDLVLVATRRASPEGGAKRLQALQCWPLGVVVLEQLTPPASVSSEHTYVVNLRAGALSFVYQTDRYDHFTRVMAAYKKGRAAVSAREREADPVQGHRRMPSAAEDNPDKRQLRDSLRSAAASPVPEENGSRPASHRQSQELLLKDLSARVHSRNRSHDVRTEHSAARMFADLRATEDKLDEVDVHLAHNEYVSAVGLVRHIEAKLAGVVERIAPSSTDDPATDELRLLVDVVRLKIDGRKMKVQQALSFQLHHGIAALSTDEIASIVEFYEAFGRLDDGVSTLWDAMSAHLANTVGRLIGSAHGSTRVDIVNYLANLTIVYVSIVRRAVEIYKKCVEPVLARGSTMDSSGFVTWCVGEMSQLVDTLKTHASGTLLVDTGGIWRAKDSKYYTELVRMVQPQLALLRSDGLNVDYLFSDIMECQPA
ncbi:putative exocyst complex component [Clavispora lusitaniae]|uniref:Exocyst complex component n=1 Tax=Clavispora lusitaniae TaxID=36911 RepID=A0ACD0WST8_CLALS|nr:exocyst complex component exo84 [Clavispora lusitaniae]QFZ30480.1 putative exocyst complex component [Clavispora lusitaniae]QFZ36142.1 putative exocyst complex component [Clavispora lusitaniae]QFZ41826.1 putative exocyst complex component [Clavispora lusitaniae]QFZ47502.1 putative exocyst complex component [Clavispora lusitaniae]